MTFPGVVRKLATIDVHPRKLHEGAEYGQALVDTRLYEVSLTGSDTISGISWRIAPSGPTIAALTPVGGIASALVSGLQSGIEYRLSAFASGGAGQIYQRSAQIACQEPDPSNWWEQGAVETRLYQVTLNGDSVAPESLDQVAAWWQIAPAGPSISAQAPVGKTVSALVSAIAQNVDYLLTALIVTEGGQVVKQTATIAGILD